MSSTSGTENRWLEAKTREHEVQDALVAHAIDIAVIGDFRHDAAQVVSSAHVARSLECPFLRKVMRKSMQHFDRAWSRTKVVPEGNN